MVVRQEIQEELRTIEFIPPGIDLLVVAPQRLLSDQPNSRLTKVEGMLLDKITGKDVQAVETWDGDATNLKTFRPYDGIIVICDDLAGVAEKIQRVSRESNAPVLILSGTHDPKSWDKLLSVGRTPEKTVYDIVSPDALTLYDMTKFIVYTAYRKLMPDGNVRVW